MFNKYGLLLVAAISVSSQIVVAGGDGSEFDSLAAELAGFGPQVRVVGPDEVVAFHHEVLNQVAAAHG